MNHSNICNFYCISKGVSAEQDPSLPLEKSFSRFLIKLYLEWTKGIKAQRYIIAMKSLLPLKKVSIVNIEK